MHNDTFVTWPYQRWLSLLSFCRIRTDTVRVLWCN